MASTIHSPQALLARQQSSLAASSRCGCPIVRRHHRHHPLRAGTVVLCTSVVDKDPTSGNQKIEELPSGTSKGQTHAVVGGVSNNLIRSPDDLTLPPGQLSTGSTGCADNQWRFETSGYMKKILTAKVYDVAVETPLEHAARTSDALGVELFLKREDLQPVFSFKLRGAYNKMAHMTPEQRAKGVICSSAGNHAQGVALSASKLGCEATVCMPTTTPDIKVDAVRRLGGAVELVGESYQETQAYAQGCSVSDGRVFVAPYDDPFVIAGQGTVAAEVVRQLGPKVDSLHAIFVAVGGGGLIAGIAAYIKQLCPHVKVIGVEPTGANAMAQSLQEGQRVTLSKVDAFADGVAVKQVGAETFRLCREHVDGVVLVDNSAISAAIKDVFNETRSILEPAGAVAVAGAKAYCRANKQALCGMAVVAVTSGANMNFDRLRLVSELADVGARSEAMLATTIPEAPGSFKDFVGTAVGNTDIQVTEFKYRYSAGTEAHVLFSVRIRDAAQLDELVARLNNKQMYTDDISNLEAAQVHLRHLVGGRARSYMGEVPYERIFQVEFPERPGALKQFLDAVSPIWNITLFHYRNTGNQSSTVLLGMQVPPGDWERFSSVQESLRGNFAFEELSEDARKVFVKFIA